VLVYNWVIEFFIEPPDLLPGHALILRKNSTVEHVVSHIWLTCIICHMQLTIFIRLF